jgi:flavin reductase (DIM6/NTAB) family NADH-FMN oxidoreductase RutF
LLDSALATFECATTAAHPGGDHTVLIGAVLAVETPHPEAPPLVWHRGRYTALAEPPEGPTDLTG